MTPETYELLKSCLEFDRRESAQLVQVIKIQKLLTSLATFQLENPGAEVINPHELIDLKVGVCLSNNKTYESNNIGRTIWESKHTSKGNRRDPSRYNITTCAGMGEKVECGGF